MTKVIEQKESLSLEVVTTDGFAYIIQGSRTNIIEKKKLREVSLAIYDFEKERNEFAVNFSKWSHFYYWFNGAYWIDRNIPELGQKGLDFEQLLQIYLTHLNK